MSIGTLGKLKKLDTHPSFQLKLSQLFINPPSLLHFQSDSSILALRDGSTVDIYLCDDSFTGIEKYKPIEDVRSLKDIKVKYNCINKQLILIYRKKNQIFLQKQTNSKVDQNQLQLRFTREERMASASFNQQAPILNISDIVETHHQLFCLITLTSGKIYFLSYQNGKLSIHNTKKQENYVFGLLKNIIPPFKKQNLACYKNCQSYLEVVNHSGRPCLYALFLLDRQLHMRYYGELGSQSIEKKSWQQYLDENMLPLTCNILKILFMPSQNMVEVQLILCCSDKEKIVLYLISINLIQKIKQVKKMIEMLNEQQKMQDEDETPLQLNKQSDRINLQFYNNKLYLLLQKNQNINAYMARKYYYLAQIQKHQSSWVCSPFSMLEVSGELEMIKLTSASKHNLRARSQLFNHEEGQSLIFVGESKCQFFQNKDIQSPISMDLQKMLDQMSSSKRTPPPVPAYQQRTPQKFVISSSKDEQKNMYEHNFYNPFSPQKLTKYLQKKEYVQLFRKLRMQKFPTQLSERCDQQIDRIALMNYLHGVVLLRLFNTQVGLNNSLQQNLIQTIFPKLYKKNSDHAKFLERAFIIKDWVALKSIIDEFLQQRQYKRLYQICIDTIPNFIQRVAQIYNNSKSEHRQNQIEEQSWFKINFPGFCPLYLYLYETLAEILSNSQIPEKKQFSEYEHKQLLDKYVFIESLIERKKGEITNSKLEKIISMYIKNSVKYGKFLVSLSIKYDNISLFDFFVRNRLVDKEDIQQFLNRNRNSHEDQQILRILVNLINTELKFIYTRPSNQPIRGLSILTWIPNQFSLQHPGIGIIYGYSIMSRKQLAQNIQNRLSDFERFSSSQQLLSIIGPLYSVGSADLKANIDLAILYGEKPFYSKNRILRERREMVDMGSKGWEKFAEKASKYLSEDQICRIRTNLNLNL